MTLHQKKQNAFTLIELLVVIAIIALLLSVVLPALASVKMQARKIVCRTNLHQLLLANLAYAAQNDEHYVPAAPDISHPDNSLQNLTRWHGKRQDLDHPFDPDKGPLASYLQTGKVKECPQKANFLKGQAWNANYEDGAGGYGYNITYIGSRHWDSLTDDDTMDQATTRTIEIKLPAKTLMFADCAITKYDTDGQPYYLETSFAWQVFVVYAGQVYDGTGGWPAIHQSPTIHFRHNGLANIGWSDGHISDMPMASLDETNVFNVASAQMQIGWFDPLDNRLFDLK